MKNFEILKLGIVNAQKKPVASLITALSFTLIFTLCIMSFYYIGYTVNEMKKLLSGQISRSYISCMPDADEEVGKCIEIMNKVGLTGAKKIFSGLLQQQLLSQLIQSDIALDEISNFSLLIDGQTYIGRNDNSYTFGIDEKNAASEDIHYEDTTVRFGMTVLAGNRPFIATENERKEFKGKYPDDQMVLYGKEIAGGNEVMISDYMLEKFGVPTNEFVSLVGKKISVVYDDGVKASVLIEDSSICGILSQNFFRVERNRYSAQFFIHLDNSSLRQLADFDLTIETDVPEFKAMEDAVKKLEASNSGSISYDERVVKIYGDLELEKEIMSFVLSLVVLAISIAFVMNICYIQYDQIQKKKYFFGLLGAIGMPRRSIRKLLFSELCFIAVLAAILSSIISVVLLRAIAHYTEGVLGSALYNQPSQFMAPSLMVFIAAPAISGIIACYNEMRLNKERLIALLNKSTVD